MPEIIVHSYTMTGMIDAVIDGEGMWVPDDAENPNRQLIAGWESDGNVIPPYVAPEPVIFFPSQISDRQFFQQLALDGRITEKEALDAVGSGIIPTAMIELINQLPTDMQFTAKMLVRGATVFERTNAVTLLIQQLYNWTDQERDDFWLAASKL